MKKIVCGILAGCLVLATATGCQKNASGKTPITLNEVAPFHLLCAPVRRH